MSAFLGPIHHLMYSRIHHQEMITAKMLAAAERQGWHCGLRQQLAEHYGEVEDGVLEQVIDTTNIHGWLKQQVDLAESRFAYVVETLLDKNPELLDQLGLVCRQDGAEYGAEQPDSASCEEIYQQINRLLLNGMPCDGGVRLQSEQPDQITWELVPELYREYWRDPQTGISNWLYLRDQWMAGYITRKSVTYERINETTFRLKEE